MRHSLATVRAICRKDWTLLWPLVALVTAIQAGLELATYRGGLFGDDLAAATLVHPLTLAWFAAIAALTAATVHQDPVPGVDQDWLIRPLGRTDLLAAKLLFVVVTILGPMLVLNLLHVVAMGFPWRLASALVAYKELYVLACLVLPCLALAAATRNLTDFAALGAALVVVFATTLFASAVLRGSGWCPTCGSGVAWLQRLLQHAGILAGAVTILGLQYYQRRTRASRTLALAGTVALVLAQLPWDGAFTLQSRLSAATVAPAAASLAVEAAGATRTERPAAPPARTPDARQAARALLHGSVDDADAYLRRHTDPRDPPVSVEIPVHVRGIPPDAFAIIDRADVRLLDGGGTERYRSPDASDGPGTLLPDHRSADAGPEPPPQRISIPASAWTLAHGPVARLQVDYSLTVMQPRATYRIGARNGGLRAPGVGVCATRSDADAIHLRCQQLGAAPFCFGATVYGPDGRHNPEVRSCSPDYRPYLPSPTTPLTFVGVNVPIRDPQGLARYPVDPADLRAASLVITVYGVAGHYQRRLVVTPLPAP